MEQQFERLLPYIHSSGRQDFSGWPSAFGLSRLHEPAGFSGNPRHVRLEAVVEGGQLAFGEKATYDDTSIFAYAGATAVSGVKRESLFVGIRDGRPVIMRPACICFCMT